MNARGKISPSDVLTRIQVIVILAVAAIVPVWVHSGVRELDAATETRQHVLTTFQALRGRMAGRMAWEDIARSLDRGEWSVLFPGLRAELDQTAAGPRIALVPGANGLTRLGE